jgi:hypothetical protein
VRVAMCECVYEFVVFMYMCALNNKGENYCPFFLYFAGTKENKYDNTQIYRHHIY